MNPHLAHVYQLIPLLLLAVGSLTSEPFIPYREGFASDWVIVVASFLTFVFSLGKNTPTKRTLFFIGLTLLTALALNHMIDHPTLGTVTATVYIFAAVAKPIYPPSYRRLFLISEVALGLSLLIALTLYLSLVYHKSSDNGLLIVANGLAFGSVLYISCAKLKIGQNLGLALTLIAPSVSLALWAFELLDLFLPIGSVLLVGAAALASLAIYLGRLEEFRQITQNAFSRPEIIIIAYFSILAMLGCLLLQLPASQQLVNGPHSFIDSLFTAMSAVCVTGLIVLDTPVDFSLFGQGVILALIQLGGLGIVSMSAWVIFFFQSRNLSVKHEQTIADLSGYRPRLVPAAIIKRILTYFFTFEVVGTLVLFVAFLETDNNISTALWRAVFTSVSAFCNAGFALQSDSLMPYQDNAAVVMTVSVLIIAGGIAPLLAIDISRTKLRRLNLQSKLSITATIFLLCLGFFIFLPLEWGYSLSGLDVSDKIMNAWFQSVTTRTAGFNTIALLDMREITSIVFMVFMFIGGNPGSAAGGIKTVTAAVIVCAGLSAIRGNRNARVFNRTISLETILRAITVIGLGLCSGFMAFLALSVTQNNIDTIPLLFETVSALGTVGLSLGATTSLDQVGKVIILICMIAGRVGPITFISLLVRNSPEVKWSVPEEDVYIS